MLLAFVLKIFIISGRSTTATDHHDCCFIAAVEVRRAVA